MRRILPAGSVASLEESLGLFLGSSWLVFVSKMQRNDEQTTRVYEFGPFSADAGERVLRCEGEPLPLAPKIFETLLVLLKNSGHIVEKSALMEAVWPETFVEESNLAANVSVLRKVLGTRADGKPYIETVARRGYRFAAEVTEIQNGEEFLLRRRTRTRIIATEEIEEPARSLPPAANSEAILALPGGEAPTSNAESLLSQAKRHKLGVAIALSALALLVVVVGLKYPWRSAPRAEPFSKIKVTRLTTNGKASEAAISPEGKYVVHVMGSAGQQSLWLRHIATGSDTEIVPATGGNFGGATFSQDGSYIYFTREDARESVLYQVPVLGGVPKKVGADIDTVVTFSPDSKRFAFLRGYPQYGEYALMLANADGTGEQKLVSHKGRDFTPAVRPAWSPKADVIAAASRKPEAEGGYRTIITVGVRDGAETNVTSHEWTSIEAFEWLADGSALVVIAADQETAPAHQIWHVAYPSGAVRRITNDTRNYHNVSLTPDVSSFVTVQSETISNIWVAPDADAGRATAITSNTNDGRQGLAWTPDGRVVYQSRASGNPDLWITDANGRDPKQLTRESSAETSPVVTPDGRYILFSSRDEGKLNVWRMNSDGSDPKPLTSGSQPAADNQSVYYVSSINGKLLLSRVSIDGGIPAPLTDYTVVGPVLSPDGKQLACGFVDDQARSYRVGILRLEGGAPIKVLDLQRSSLLQGLRWTPDSQALTYIDTRAGVSNLWRLPLDGSAVKQITDFKTEQIFRFDWSRDGRSLAVARGFVTSDVVLVKDSK